MLSLAMIVRDEVEHLGPLLHDVGGLCDEVIVVDTGSTDETKAVAEAAGAKVFDFLWVEDFAAARNYSFSKCTGDWILWLDADDRVPVQSAMAIRQIYAEICDRIDIDAVMLPYQYEFTDDAIPVPRTVLWRERILRNQRTDLWKGAIHECVEIDSTRVLVRGDAPIEHHPSRESLDSRAGRNLAIAQRTVEQGDRSARALGYLAIELSFANRFGEAVDYFEECLRLPMKGVNRYDLLCAYAATYEALGDETRHLGLLIEAMVFDSRRSEAFVQLGLIWMKSQQWSRAIAMFAAATATQPREGDFGVLFLPGYSWFSWEHLAACAALLGRHDLALSALRRSVDGHPNAELLLANIENIMDDQQLAMTDRSTRTSVSLLAR